MRKFLGELKIMKGSFDDKEIVDVLRNKGFMVMSVEETKIIKRYKIFDKEQTEGRR